MTTTTKAKKQERIVRTYPATMDEVWDLWTTKEGIEAWWGPEGFEVEVDELDFRAGGQMVYTMTAVAPSMVAFMKNDGLPVSTTTTIRFTEVTPPRHLAYVNVVDFIPGVPTYEVGVTLDLEPTEDGVRLVLLLDAMHDAPWTERALAGWKSELGKLDKLIASRVASRAPLGGSTESP